MGFGLLGYIVYYSLSLGFFFTSIHLARDALVTWRDGGIWLLLAAATSAGVGIILTTCTLGHIQHS